MISPVDVWEKRAQTDMMQLIYVFVALRIVPKDSNHHKPFLSDFNEA